jgi:uncharacterized MAPEG superfamily protein
MLLDAAPRNNVQAREEDFTMSPSATALAGFALWQLLLTVALAFYRTALVLGGKKAANAFATDGSDVPGFGQRLTRARDNCFENLPMVAALILAANLTGKLSVTDPLAPWLLYARLAHSLTHVISTSVPAVQLRFAFYLAQVAIMIWWAVELLCH